MGSYLETGGEGAIVRPWVWVAFLFFSPTLTSVVVQWYQFLAVCQCLSLRDVFQADYRILQSRMVVHAEATLTQVIFDHALKIRVKAETVESSNSAKLDDNAQGSSSEPLVHKQADNLAGKLNNLITTDMSTMFWGRDFLVVGMYRFRVRTSPSVR